MRGVLGLAEEEVVKGLRGLGEEKGLSLNLELEGIREWGFGRRKERDVVVVVVALMLPIFVSLFLTFRRRRQVK